MSSIGRFAVGLALGVAVGWLARRQGALTTSGAVAAAVLGACAVVAGWGWAFLLIAYFVSSTGLTRLRQAEKRMKMADRVEKSGARDAAQVASNGGAFAVASIAYAIHPHLLWQSVGAAALAASAADTWATELGALANARPRSVVTWRPVPIGTSGGVTAQGLLAGTAGAAFIAVVSVIAGFGWQPAAGAFIGGTFACLLDSLYGAVLQSRRWCAACETLTEQRVHHCGSTTAVVGGLPWLDNDGVNAAATISGSVIGAVAAAYFVRA